jgi:hypothetical protein
MKRPSAKQPSPPATKPNRWNIYHIKGTPAVLLGHVEAPDEESAIKRAIEEFAVATLFMSTPTRRTPPGCCARAASGNAAALLSPAIKSRRRISHLPLLAQ